MEGVRQVLLDVALMFGGVSIVLIAIVVWISKILQERIIKGMERQNQKALEGFKAELLDGRLGLEAAIKVFGAGQDHAYERRLDAIECAWKSMLWMRSSLGGKFLNESILTDQERETAVLGGKCHEFLDNFHDEIWINSWMEQVGGHDIEARRILIGPSLWAIYFVYRAFLGRMFYLYHDSIKKKKFRDWKADD